MNAKIFNMKIITLNTWGGRLADELSTFLEKHVDIDVFCFQEVYDNALGKENVYMDGINVDLHDDLKTAFPKHRATYVARLEDWWGISMFIKKDYKIIREGWALVHEALDFDQAQQRFGHTPKVLQYASIKQPNGKIITVLNLHGLWNGQGKTDSKDRLDQSKNIINCIQSLPGEIVFCGDFNLNPDTKSLEHIERCLDLRNLVTEYNVKSTRTSRYKKEGKFADYILVSQGLTVVEFKVLPDEVSDHAPLYVEVV